LTQKLAELSICNFLTQQHRRVINSEAFIERSLDLILTSIMITIIS